MSYTLSRSVILYGCRGCPDFRLAAPPGRTLSLHDHLREAHQEISPLNWPDMVMQWGTRYIYSNGVLYDDDLHDDQPLRRAWENDHHLAIQDRANSSALPGVVVTTRHGCIACPALHFDRRAAVDVLGPEQTCLQHHVDNVHPGVKEWRGLWYKWGYRIKHADQSIEDNEDEEDEEDAPEPMYIVSQSYAQSTD